MPNSFRRQNQYQYFQTLYLNIKQMTPLSCFNHNPKLVEPSSWKVKATFFCRSNLSKQIDSRQCHFGVLKIITNYHNLPNLNFYHLKKNFKSIYLDHLLKINIFLIIILYLLKQIQEKKVFQYFHLNFEWSILFKIISAPLTPSDYQDPTFIQPNMEKLYPLKEEDTFNMVHLYN